jgi:hypothetical protein
LRPWRNARLLIITGLAATVAANLVFMYLLTGNALHILKVLSSVATNYYSNGGETVISYPGYYFKYLFLNIQHTGLLGILALGGVAFWLIRCRNLGVADIGVGYVVVWGLGLLFLFSFFIISLSPVIFIAKQTNYMMIFVAPLSMLGGYLIAQMRQTYGYTVLGIAAIIGIVLGAMEQASTQTFTANSRAAIIFAGEHQGIPVYGSENSERISSYDALFSANKIAHIHSLAGLNSTDLALPGDGIAYAIWDRQTEDWLFSPIHNQKDIPVCWLPAGVLKPAEIGLSSFILLPALHFLEYVPGRISAPVKRKLSELVYPKPAFIYVIPSGCNFKLAAKEKERSSVIK